ncbi:hypothetical protein [Paludibaculum fermentans]|uniref:hypothetical protein n=1 Tax=Paludibaculum fermentans TaxID=1473598 RepID=UPI003EBD8EA3
MAGPITGLVFDGLTGSLRLILGMPGAARLDTTLVSEVDWASVAPDGRTAIMVRHGETLRFSREETNDAATGVAIPGAIEKPDQSAWSADSTAVALYSATARTVQWIRFGSDGAHAETAVPLTGVDGPVTALTGDSASTLIVIAVENAGLYRVSPADGTTLILPILDASSIAMEPGGRTIWVGDRSTAQVVEIALDQEGATSKVLFTDPEHFADLSMIGLSPDKKTLYLADRPTKRLYLVDRSTMAIPEPISLDAPATMLAPIGRSSVLLLSPREKADQPLYILDASSSPTVYFVPVAEGR